MINFLSIFFFVHAVFGATASESFDVVDLNRSAPYGTKVKMTVHTPQACQFFVDGTKDIYFIKEVVGRTVRKTAVTLLEDFRKFITEYMPEGYAFHSATLDKVLRDGAGLGEPANTMRTWLLKDAHEQDEEMVGHATINIVGAPYKFIGTTRNLLEDSPCVEGYKERVIPEAIRASESGLEGRNVTYWCETGVTQDSLAHAMLDGVIAARRGVKRKAQDDQDFSDCEPQAKSPKLQFSAEDAMGCENTQPSLFEADAPIEKTLAIRKYGMSGCLEYSRNVDTFLDEKHQVAVHGKEDVIDTDKMLRAIVQCAQEKECCAFYSVVLDHIFHDIARTEGFFESSVTRWHWKLHRYGAKAEGLKDRVVIDFGGLYCLSGRGFDVASPKHQNIRELQGYSLVLKDWTRTGPGSPLYYWAYDASKESSSKKLKVVKTDASGRIVYSLGADAFLNETHKAIDNEGVETTETMLWAVLLSAQRAGGGTFYSVVLDNTVHHIVRTEGFFESSVDRWQWSIHPCDTKVEDLKDRTIMWMDGLCCLSGKCIDPSFSNYDDLQGYRLVFRDYEKKNREGPLFYWGCDASKQKPLL